MYDLYLVSGEKARPPGGNGIMMACGTGFPVFL
jgi:hypothetical protein